MAKDPISALGERLEARLNAQDARLKTVEDAVKAQVSANTIPPFTLLNDGTKQFAFAPAGGDNNNRPAAITPPVSADFGVGATFRRKGVLSDVPMAVTRVGNGVVFAAFTDSEGSREVAFHPDQLDLVTSAPSNLVADALSFFPTRIDLNAPSMPAESVNDSAFAEGAADEPTPTATLTASVPTASAAVAAAPTSPSPAAAAPAPAPAPSAATPTAAAASVSTPPIPNTPAPFIMLPDGTKQFGYAPTGDPSINSVQNKTPAVTADFGVGATIRRKGVMGDTPMTVTRVGNGVVFANFTDSEGTREVAFYPNQMDLITPAP